MADDTITMHYGNFPAWRAEVFRIPLVLAGVPFEDKRYHPYFNEEMRCGAQEAGAGNAPWLSLPDGWVLCQTAAMARYCATRAGMTPADLFDASKVDELLQSVTDFSETLKLLFSGFSEKLDEEKIKLLYDWMEGPRNKWLSYFEKRLSQNGGGLLVGNSLTIADIALWRTMDSMLDPCHHPEQGAGALTEEAFLAENFPKVLKHLETIDAHPGIRAYMSEKYPEGKGLHPMEGTPYESMIRVPDGKWWWKRPAQPTKPEAVEFWKQHGKVGPVPKIRTRASAGA